MPFRVITTTYMGATERKGSVADKTSVSDTEPEEGDGVVTIMGAFGGGEEELFNASLAALGTDDRRGMYSRVTSRVNGPTP